MSNHSQNDLPDFLMPESLRKQIGATGRFPLGKLSPDDEGEITFAVAADHQTKTVVVAFGKPVAWLAMPRDDAERLAELLVSKVRELSRE